jgi:hypothetical protein
MKLSAHLAELKRQKQLRQAASGPAHAPGGKRVWWRWAVVALCLVLAAGGTWFVLDRFVWSKVPRALVGQWQVTDGPASGSIFTFGRDGSLVVDAGGSGADLGVKARVVVEGKLLLTVTRDPQTGQEQTRKSTIQELSETSLVLELENRQTLRLVRRN